MSATALLLALAVLVGGRGIDQDRPRPAETARYAERAPEGAPTPAGRTGTALSGVRGVASWGFGWAGVVTRYPRGTRVCVVGPLGRWCGRSVGYGPAAWTHRIADLSRPVFARVCGDPSRGLCRVTLEVVSW